MQTLGASGGVELVGETIGYFTFQNYSKQFDWNNFMLYHAIPAEHCMMT